MSSNLNNVRKRAFIREQSILGRENSMYKGPEAAELECVAGVEQRGEDRMTARSGRSILLNPQLGNSEL